MCNAGNVCHGLAFAICIPQRLVKAFDRAREARTQAAYTQSPARGKRRGAPAEQGLWVERSSKNRPRLWSSVLGIVLMLLLISVPKLTQTCQVFRLGWGCVQRFVRRSQETQKGSDHCLNNMR